MFRRAMAVGAVGLAFGLALARDSRPERPRTNVVLVVVDTLRVDRLGCYGNPRGLTPAIDALAARGTRFQHAYAQSSWTMPSVGSLMTSRMPFDHGAFLFPGRLADENVTLAEALHGDGYATAAFLANPLLLVTAGFAQGFDAFDVPIRRGKPPRALEVNYRVADWLAHRSLVRDGSGFFLYVHYMEPHPPYGNTEKLTRLLDGRPVPDIAATSAAYMASRRKPLTPEQMERVEEVYDAEVAEMDDGVAWLVRSLHDLRMLDHTVIVFTADHGEEFLDHGGTGHGATLHEELVHVPLIVAAPDAAPRVVDDTVALIDVAPTVLDLLGIPAPREFQGRSLAAEIVPPGSVRAFFRRLVGFFQPSEPGIALSHVAERTERPDPANAQRAVVRGLHKAIAVGQNPPEYYDLVVDPHERSPAALTPEERAPLDRLLQALREREPAAPAETEPLDPAKRRQLRALGYVD